MRVIILIIICVVFVSGCSSYLQGWTVRTAIDLCKNEEGLAIVGNYEEKFYAVCQNGKRIEFTRP